MTTGLRWRIMTLQAVLVLVLGFCAGFLFYESSFVNGQIHDQLASQKIYFPAADSAAIKALPASDASAMKQYAGQQLTTGAQAQTYADHFIAVHLREVAGGKTYAQASAASQANPKDTALAAQVQTLFRGETLRGLLLNAYGWSQVAMYAFFGAIGLTIAAGGVLVAFAFEVFVALRRREPAPARTVPGGRPAPTA
ncbi:MAG: hypothetical protein J2P45_07785 [Candidatus Dormibacteraeota bacterium]|nr:hypothetical protein [Candidatus Dormibacteraeota bacterium]